MFYNVKVLFSIALLLPYGALADTIVAFSGSSCDGSIGSNVPCDGSCQQFGGRHSLRISGGGTHCVTYFENSNCAFQEGQGGTNIFGSNVCQNVNTGGPVNSFICAPSTTCLV